MAVDVDGCAPVAAGLLKRLGAVLDAAAAVDVGGAELPPRLGNCDDPPPPPRLGKSDWPDVAVVAVGPLVAVDVGPLAGTELVGAEPAGLPQLNDGALLVATPVLEGAAAKRPPPGAAELVGVAELPPRVNVGGAVPEACPGACAEEFPPRLNPPRGFAGVDEGVVLASPPKSPELGAVGAEEVGVVVLFASAEAPVFPRLKRPEPGAELPKGLAAADAPPNRLGAAEEEVVAGCAPPPNKDEPVWALEAAGLFCWPNKEEPD